MTATYAIVYAKKSKMLRRVISDDDGQVSTGMMPDGKTFAVVCKHPVIPPSYYELHPEEDVIIGEVESEGVQPHHYHYWNDIIEQHCGEKPRTITCRVINEITHEEVNLIIADPEIDKPPAGHKLEAI